ncbi:MAG: hypothetical protein WHT29_08650 [Bacteroidales bacterium]|nr:hypothetical protein [Bacteroidales bacterium]HOK99413.1 hypothetical protein [Bacteroidales bacterium]HPO64934.1 hypothetical protein [Bacteroidales bacterium]
MAQVTKYKFLYLLGVVLLGIFILLITKKCEKKRPSPIELTDTIAETIPIPLPSKDIAYYLPGPQITNQYLKKLGIYPNKTLVNSYTNIEKYTTSENEALVLGVFIVDVGYMNLYREDESTENYLKAISQLARNIGLGSIFTADMYKKMVQLRNNQDSLQRYLSYVFVTTNDFLKSNAQQRLATLVMAGAWIESFYLLCETYKEEGSTELLTFLYQQKYILDNLIQAVKYFYKTSPTFDYIIETLIEMAYNFDVLDFRYTYKNPAVTKENDIYHVHNSCEISGSASALEKILSLTDELRTKVVQ